MILMHRTLTVSEGTAFADDQHDVVANDEREVFVSTRVSLLHSAVCVLAGS